MEDKKILFKLDSKTDIREGQVELLSIQMKQILLEWKRQARFKCLAKWRGEEYPIYLGPGDPWESFLSSPIATTVNAAKAPPSTNKILMYIERCSVPIFGIRGYGCHLNGFIVKDGQISMWIARRSKEKQTYPGMLDNMVGGGLPKGFDPIENIVKESFEEASIPEELASKCQPSGRISFCFNVERGLVVETDYIFDLELPHAFKPLPHDNEVEEFYLWDLETVCKHLINEEFTPEAGLCIINFLLRRNLLDSNCSNNKDLLSDALHGEEKSIETLIRLVKDRNKAGG